MMGCLALLIYIACALIVLATVHLVWVVIMMSTLAIGAKLALFGIFVLFMAIYLIAGIVDSKY